MNVIIIEDEELAAKRLETMILKADNSIKILAKLESIEESVDWLKSNNEPDLIFLDIHLEDGISFSIFEKVKVSSPIIFTTAFDEYAIKAFKLKSVDYLLKPVTQEELEQSITKYREWVSPQNSSPLDMHALYEMIQHRTPQFRSRFSIVAGQKIKTVGIEEIAYFHAEEGVVCLVTDKKVKYPLDLSLDQLNDQLDPKEFFRINRQYIVKLSAIENIHVYPKSKLQVELQPSAPGEVFVSLDKVTKFKDWLNV
ncbi:LytR/AlgR family response regulator transcription factor [Adhaeribacter aquaticus]|uniref:LytR/AlgR family response regulator transcription factor n=1 Tax=Adhaeribacter aquaticus TaxID=299567 RepID=UPI000428B14A|nr:LytTR family DNA-binding domain-containing protein [Adhaeribacter aquaticus]